MASLQRPVSAKAGDTAEKEPGAEDKASRSACFSGTAALKCSANNLRFNFL